MPFIPSAEQTLIYSHIADPNAGNLIVSACPGSGKTTTIINGFPHCARRPNSLTPPSICYLVFNKRNVDEAKTKCPSTVSVSTFHSLGFRALKDSGLVPRTVKVDGGKCRQWIFNAMGRDNPDTQLVSRLVSLLKTQPPREPGTTKAESLAAQHNLDFAEPDKAFQVAIQVLCRSNAELSVIDFDDMLYLPVALGCSFTTYDYVFTDECQDTNEVQCEILARLAKPGQGWISWAEWPEDVYSARISTDEHSTMEQARAVAGGLQRNGFGGEGKHFPIEVGYKSKGSPTRFIFVGDPYQGIYGFRGAQSDAMNVLRTRFGCTELSLSVSYRCPQAVVAEAQRIIGGSDTVIQPHPTAPQGEVKHIERYTSAFFIPGCAVLCRVTAPLVRHAYALLQRDVPCTIRGKDIGAQLCALVRKMRGAHLEDLQAKLLVWRDREVGAALAADKSPERIEDQYACVVFFIRSLDEDSRTIDSLLAKIDLMFSDVASAGKVVLSTIHKAKGLEYPIVYILDRATTLPSRYATQPWQRVQERNLWFVAVTRAQEALYYINSESWQEDADAKAL